MSEVETVDKAIDRLTNRHLAKLLTRLGGSIAPVQEAEIKRQMWFLSSDIKQVINQETSDNGNDETEGQYNR